MKLIPDIYILCFFCQYYRYRNLFSIMIKEGKHKIINGYSKLKPVRHFDGFKTSNFGSSFVKNAPNIGEVEI